MDDCGIAIGRGDCDVTGIATTRDRVGVELADTFGACELATGLVAWFVVGALYIGEGLGVCVPVLEGITSAMLTTGMLLGVEFADLVGAGALVRVGVGVTGLVTGVDPAVGELVGPGTVDTVLAAAIPLLLGDAAAAGRAVCVVVGLGVTFALDDNDATDDGRGVRLVLALGVVLATPAAVELLLGTMLGKDEACGCCESEPCA